MVYNKWGSGQAPTVKTRVPIILRQVFALTKRGYFRWLVMSLPAYILGILMIFLLTRDSHLFQTTATTTAQPQSVSVSYRLPLPLLLAIGELGMFWGQVFSAKSIAAEYFAYNPADRSVLRVPIDIIVKAFFVSLVIGIFFVFGYILLVVPAVFWLLFNYPVMMSVSFENQPNFFDFYRRSRQLVRYNKGRIFLVQTVLGILQLVVGSVVLVVLTNQTTLTAGPTFTILGVITFLFAPINSCAAFVFYADLRMQKENISPEQLAVSIGIPLSVDSRETPPFSGNSNNSPGVFYNADPPPYGQSANQYFGNSAEESGQTGSQSVPEYGATLQSGFGGMRQDLMLPDPGARSELGSLPYVQDLSPMDRETQDSEAGTGADADDNQENSGISESDLS